MSADTELSEINLSATEAADGDSPGSAPKRKVGRPITSERTLARNFPAIDEIRDKLATGECFGRQRANGSSSGVWKLFEEIAYTNTQLFTGIVRCSACQFMTRYHGQITGTSHMRRHHCFRELFPEQFANPQTRSTPTMSANKIKKEPKVTPKLSIGRQSNSTPMSSLINRSATDTPNGTPKMLVQANNKLANIKSELRERILQLCYNELISVETVTSDSFKAIVQSLVKLITAVGKGSISLPDSNQLYAQMTGQYNQCKNRVKEGLNTALDRNIGAALSWQLVESILSASALGCDINLFISQTLDDFGLNEDRRLAKFTFISRGGLFDGVSMCLTSMAHVIDAVIESAVFSDDNFTEIVENCKVICAELRLVIDGYPIEWVNKYEVMRYVVESRHKFELKNSSLDLGLVEDLVDFLGPFKAAAIELRQCSRHPTINHVLLWYYKLLKHLNTTGDDETSIADLKTVIKTGMEQNFQLQTFHKIAAFLWPNFRFLKMLSSEEREEVHNEVRNLIETRAHIEDLDGIGDDCVIRGVDSSGASNPKKARSDFDEWEEQVSDKDELNKYISVQLTTCNEQNILSWWKDHQNEFPKLAKLAKWILSIPASVTSLERFRLLSNQDINQELLFMHCNAKKQNEEKRISAEKRKTVSKQR
ncbi:zinc finger protein 618-like isoform X2 [Oppia nitens]|uniref:zinc finger protein 618-like isoform X2 n=1 Tax=Oppia nitens TaxID=1686743 RepID=UPI0023DA7A48|nr:zinc finger protein 618-like isoform X2 [Oppia nitens]